MCASIRFAARAAPELRRGNRQPIRGLCRAVRRGGLGTGCAEPDRDRRSDPHRDRGHDRCGEVAKEAAEQHNRALLDRVSKNWAKVQWCARIVALQDRAVARQ
jgi:hypothetical protein